MFENEIIISYLKKGVFINVGAHIGRASKMFAEKGWKVISFEPHKKYFKRLVENTKGLDVICINKAISDVNGTFPFYTSDVYWGISSFIPFDKTHKFAYKVETVTLKDALKDFGIENVTFLKIDVEGSDFAALKGFDFDRYRPKIVMVEFIDDILKDRYTHHDMVDYMKAKDYSAYVSETLSSGYSREDYRPPRKWLGILPYPVENPKQGNIIFVPNEDKEKFEVELKKAMALIKQNEEIA